MTTKHILIALTILLLAALAYWALDAYVTLTREPGRPCDLSKGIDFGPPPSTIGETFPDAVKDSEAQQ